MLSRRQLLQRLALISAGATCMPMFTSCGNGGPVIDTSLPEPYGTWTALQSVLRNSADHLPGRLTATVAGKDWRKAYDIVRNHFVTLPGRKAASPFDSSTHDIRAGQYACERAGAGTVLEQCLVLRHYLQKMGLTAELYYSKHELSERTYLKQLTRNTPPEFDATLSGELAENTKSAESFLNPDDVEPGPRKEVFAALKKNEYEPHYKGSRSAEKVPVVILTTEEGTLFALPVFGPADKPVSLTNTTGYRPLKLPVQEPVVKLTLDASVRGARRILPLLEHSFPVGEIAGRHVDVVFDNGVPLELADKVSLGSLNTFTPIFNIPRQPQDPLYQSDVPAIVGDGFTLFGDKIVRENGGASMNGKPLLVGPPQPELSARVASVETRAVGYNVPLVQLDVWARDTDGNPVEKLFASDFTVLENGHIVKPQLIQNVITPRIVILYDITSSVPAEFLDRAYIASFEEKIRVSIKKIYPNATIELKKTLDKYYDHLADEVLNPADLIICHSDGLIIGDPAPRHEAMLTKSPPVIFLHVVDEVHPDLKTLAQFIDVTPIPAGNEEAVMAEISTKLDATNLPPYRLRFFGNPATTGPTPVSVTINEKEGRSSYESEALGSAPVVESLRLTVRYGQNVDQFVLGGWDSRLGRSPEPHHAEEAFAALHTGASIYVEGAGPTTAVMLDDFLTARLSTLPVMKAEAGETLDELREAMGKTIINAATPLSLLQQFPHAVGPDHLTYPEGLRMCAHQTRIDFDAGNLTNRTSILATAGWRTESPNLADSFRRTFDHTWELARAEAALHETSTISLLRAHRLVLMSEIEDAAKAKSLDWSTADYYAFSRRVKNYGSARTATAVVAADEPVAAHFYVHNRTGEVIGVLSDLTGGGRSKKELLKRLAKVDTVLGAFINAASTAKLIPMGAFFALVGKLYIIATAHIITLDATMDSRCEMMKAMKGAMIDAVVGKIARAYVPRVAAAQSALAGNGVGQAKVSTHVLKNCAGFG